MTYCGTFLLLLLLQSFLLSILLVLPHEAAVYGLSLRLVVHLLQDLPHQILLSRTASSGNCVKRLLLWKDWRADWCDKLLRGGDGVSLRGLGNLPDGVIDGLRIAR